MGKGDHNLDGMVALVTGASRRVGRAIAVELAHAGADVAVHFRSGSQDARETINQIRSLRRQGIGVQADLTEESSWAYVVEQVRKGLGRLDILVNNASAFLTDKPDTVARFDPAHWEAMFRIHVLAPMGLVSHAEPLLSRSGRGSVINLCDISAERPWKNHLAYCTSKAGLVALTKGLAVALAPRVRVNGVSPGIAVFPREYDVALRKKLSQRVPLKRSGSPKEVAQLVRFLVESGDYITGQVIAIDGGRSVASSETG